MTTPIARVPKPDAEQYKGSRKLFLVPTYLFAPDAPEDGQQLLERYWSEVRDQIEGLERSLGKVSHIYHEALFSDGDEGMTILEGMNPKAGSFIQAMCSSDARLEATEDRAMMEESADWQRCIGVGLISESVRATAFEPELPISSCLGPSNAPSSTRAIVVSVTDAVNHPIKLTKPSLGVVS